MTEGIYLPAKAWEALNSAREIPAEVQATDPWLLVAQTHATLALVEQQRKDQRGVVQ